MTEALNEVNLESTGEDTTESESNWTFSSVDVLAKCRAFLKHAESKLEHLLDDAVEAATSEAEVVSHLLLSAMDHATEAVLGHNSTVAPASIAEMESTGEDTLGS